VLGHFFSKLRLRLLTFPLQLLLPLQVLLVQRLQPSQGSGDLPVEKLMEEDGQDHERDELQQNELPDQHGGY
jgi:hypothetical protein